MFIIAKHFHSLLHSGNLDEAELLNNVINLKRREVAFGNVIDLPGTDPPIGLRATNMEKLIWDEALSITATTISQQCTNLYTDVTELAGLYQNALSSLGPSARVIVSNDTNNILVGETIYIVENWTDADNAASQAFDAWELECERFNFGFDCNGSTTDPSLCRNCLQLIWSKSRYVGCGLTGCPLISNVTDPSIDPYNSILFVCHWYWGADLFNFSGNTNWEIPFISSGTDDFCQEMPFDIAGCNDTERNDCNSGLCNGCPR